MVASPNDREIRTTNIFSFSGNTDICLTKCIKCIIRFYCCLISNNFTIFTGGKFKPNLTKLIVKPIRLKNRLLYFIKAPI